MKIDISKINNNVVPNLEDSITDLGNVEDVAKSISIPSGFEYYIYLNSLSQYANIIKSNVKKVKDWAASLEETFDNVEKKNKQLFNGMSLTSIESSGNNNKKVETKDVKNKNDKTEYTLESISLMYQLTGASVSNISNSSDNTNKSTESDKAEEKESRINSLIQMHKNAIIELEKDKTKTDNDEEIKSHKINIYNLEQYMKLCKYEQIKEKDDFKDYLDRDYSNEIVDEVSVWNTILNCITFGLVEKEEVNKKFNQLTQEEKAIYFYLKENYSQEEADKYYESLDDLVNKRKAIIEIDEYLENLDISKLETEDGLKELLTKAGLEFKDGKWCLGKDLLNFPPEDGTVISESQYKIIYLLYKITSKDDLNGYSMLYGENSEEYKNAEKINKISEIIKNKLGNQFDTINSIANIYPNFTGDNEIWTSYLNSEAMSKDNLKIIFNSIEGLSDNAKNTLKTVLDNDIQNIDYTKEQISNVLGIYVNGEELSIKNIEKGTADEDFILKISTLFAVNGGKTIKITVNGIINNITLEDFNKWLEKDEQNIEDLVNVCLLDDSGFNYKWIDYNEDLFKAVNYIKENSNAQYDYSTFHTIENQLYTELKNTGMDSFEAADKARLLFYYLVEDRGWEIVENYNGIEIYVLKDSNFNLKTVEECIESLPQELKSTLKTIYLSDLRKSR